MAATPERRERRDPIDEERERARESTEGTQLPSEAGLGPSAGETPIADVTVEDGERREDVPDHPSLGAPPRRDESRPVFRSSQLEEGEEYDDSKLRG